jgi:sugar phosphate isomerase/epimerase
VLGLTLPAQAPGASAVASELATRAERRGVRLADHQWPVIWAAPGGSLPALDAGIDPASLLIAGADPSAEVSRHGPRLACLRLSDLGPEGRVPVGSGRLDTTSYLVACSLQAHAGPLVVDVRGLTDASRAARAVGQRYGLHFK